MQQYWLIVGSEKNWHVAFASNNLWGLKDFRELRSLWSMMREGDGLLFYVSKPVHGIVGVGNVVAKFKQTNPLWPEEIRRNEVIWPLRFEFNIEYCLPPSLWKIKRFTTHDLQMISRMVFQCFPIEEVKAARHALGLSPIAEALPPIVEDRYSTEESVENTHNQLKKYLKEIGRLQGYIADEEYPMESTYLDVVWRRVERSVPTFVFEVQVSGDIYSAMVKLKHAFDIWNSHIFLVAGVKDKAKYQEFAAGTFHEIKDHLKFIDVASIKKLLDKKRDYKEMERALGIFKQ
jgi:hypothetical protein